MSEVQLPRPIYIVSDGTGDTAEKVVRAALHQFQGYLIHLHTFPDIHERKQLVAVFGKAAADGAMLVTTLVSKEMRHAAAELAREHEVKVVDLMHRLLLEISSSLDSQPSGVPGRNLLIDDDYFKRIEAVEFTVKADDGKEPRMLREADIALLGISRTSKTPLSVFLAHKGFKVSNVPIVLDRPLPVELDRIDPRRIFALTIDPGALRDIRVQRLATMRVPGRSNYSDMDYILAELDYAEDLFRQYPSWPVIDVTRKAVEETAATILKIMSDRGLVRGLGETGQL